MAVGQVVIGAGGALVGRIVEVGSGIAHVVLISDASSTVTGQLLSSAATGKVVGQLGGALVMTDVDSAAEVAIGEEVFTAGIELGGGIRSPYPKGLLIGRVVDVTRDPNEVVQTVFLEPAAPLDNLEFLLVITNYEGGIPGPIETGVPCDPTDGGTLPDSDQPCASDAPGPSRQTRP
jgi:rod shape-determining protein MreC